MERIAIISDIHGNIPALDAVLKDIHSRQIQRIFCLGDLVGKGPDSSAAIDRIREVCEVVVKGNWDDFITKETEFETLKWHQNKLRNEQCIYLETLPFSFDFYMSGRSIRLFHASPFSLYTRIQPWDSVEKRLSMFENSVHTGVKNKQPDIVGYGDVHNAFIQHIQGKTLFNTGSVGNPLDVTQASYVILEGQYGFSEKSSSFSIQFVRVPYDIEFAIQLARLAKMPDLEPYIIELTTARYRGIKK
ncbi:MULTISPECIES: metallophosphoesterase family protein [Metabacillus]|uniref:Serine/threonine protein phosphatase n=2 Tax=Metabacillus TaxID=2675233 RepID=A0A179SZ33_9BACI|nr:MULTISPECIES: metallophosphoesterase family protein [Metabacillus]OAS86691.1 serine/threonine protein phosphatase [Metabacillus litoralis]QNF29239.1 metallophosphoesterase family protein [Metabacillus sp. KUDC1714]